MSDMASLLALRREEASTDRFMDAVASALARGHKPKDIASVLCDTAEEQKRTEKTIRRWKRDNPHFQHMYAQKVGLATQSILVDGLKPAAKALVRRASRGRPDAIKLLFEASGFHNPRIKHDHSGEVKITVSMPRPERTEDIVDADVVE